MTKLLTQITLISKQAQNTGNTQEICLNLALNMLNCYEVCLYLKFKLLTQSKEIALAAACISKHLYVKALVCQGITVQYNIMWKVVGHSQEILLHLKT